MRAWRSRGRRDRHVPGSMSPRGPGAAPAYPHIAHAGTMLQRVVVSSQISSGSEAAKLRFVAGAGACRSQFLRSRTNVAARYSEEDSICLRTWLRRRKPRLSFFVPLASAPASGGRHSISS